MKFNGEIIPNSSRDYLEGDGGIGGCGLACILSRSFLEVKFGKCDLPCFVYQHALELFLIKETRCPHGLCGADMAVTPLQVYPPQGVRPLMVHFEVVDAVNVAMTFFGDTYRHRHALGSAGLEMTKEEPADGSGEHFGNSPRGGRSQMTLSKRLETFYLMASKDVSVESEATFVTKLLTDDVVNVIIDLRLISTADEGTATYTFVEALKKIPNLMVHVV
jgi:hypothetical protein